MADDDRAVLDAIAYGLEREGYAVETVGDGEAALALARRADFDLAILNVMMPRLFGTDVCQTLRRESDLPIMLLSARDSEMDRVLGLELGADDYVTKPFSVIELLSRVRAHLRRRELDREASGILEVGDLRIDLLHQKVTVEGSSVDLTPSELHVLALLAGKPERVFTRREILESLWQSSHVGDERSCDIHVSNLRRKIERDSRWPERLLTVRGAGHMLVPFVLEPEAV